MEILGIIFIVAIGIISAVAKGKARENAKHSSEGQPQPRSAPLSDIQKAFMMAQNSGQQPTQQTPPQPQYAPPRPQYVPPQPQYMPPQPAQAGSYTPMQPRTAAATPPQPIYAAPQRVAYAPPQQPPVRASAPPQQQRQPEYHGSLGPTAREGIRASEGSGTQYENVRTTDMESRLDSLSMESRLDDIGMESRLMDSDLETIGGTGAPVRPIRTVASEKAVRKGMPMQLFENKNEYIKAVIYAEILTRRSPSRARRA